MPELDALSPPSFVARRTSLRVIGLLDLRRSSRALLLDLGSGVLHLLLFSFLGALGGELGPGLDGGVCGAELLLLFSPNRCLWKSMVFPKVVSLPFRYSSFPRSFNWVMAKLAYTLQKSGGYSPEALDFLGPMMRSWFVTLPQEHDFRHFPKPSKEPSNHWILKCF